MIASLPWMLLLAAMQLAPATSPPIEAPPEERPGAYLGVVSCAGSGCHGSPAPVADAKVLMNEYDTWFHAPAPSHVRAWDALLLPRSKAIAKTMRISTPPEQTPLCLDCHSTHVPAAIQAGRVELTDGVSCESCHGPAGGWRSRHVEEGWTHEQSVAAGMTDLRDPVVRGRTCLRCHLGTGTVTVDHELIAAGHPALVFELDNFTESRFLPPHWKRRDDPARGPRAWATGHAVQLQESARSLASLAAAGRWPDFSQMSCDSCHHPLREGAWRQERGWSGRTGMPPWSRSRWLALRHLVDMAAPSERAALDERLAAVSLAVSRMSDRTSAEAAARELDAQMARIVPAVDRIAWSEGRILELMRRIASDSAPATSDRQAAEQAAYALNSLSSWLVSVNPRQARGEIVRSVDDLYRIIDRRAHPDELDRAEVARAMTRLREALSN